MDQGREASGRAGQSLQGMLPLERLDRRGRHTGRGIEAGCEVCRIPIDSEDETPLSLGDCNHGRVGMNNKRDSDLTNEMI